MNNISVLHIANSYGGTDVYKNLISSIDNLGVCQIMYVPLNPANHSREGNHLLDFKCRNSSIIYSKSLKSYHSYFYNLKINTILKNLLHNVDISRISIIHSFSLCVDGAVAYELYKMYGIPYIVTIRNTDLNTYYKWFKWKRKYFFEIMNHATKIIFISPQYVNKLKKECLTQEENNIIENKYNVIPNGIDNIFLNNIDLHERKLNTPIKVIFAASFQKGKNLTQLINAIDLLNNAGYNIVLNAFGKGLANRKNDKSYIDELEQLANNKDWITLNDSITHNDLLRKLRESDIFAMPSKPETFGLVYVEALTQGLPILYTKDEGVDGYFDYGKVGYSVDPYDINDITSKLKMIILDYDLITKNIRELNLYKSFNWDIIAQKYIYIYNSIKY